MLINAHEVPVRLRRRHIQSGYRPTNQSVLYYLTSAFQLHNEVVNFWTHCLPVVFIYVNYVHPELFVEASPRWPLLLLYSGIIALFFASSFTHLMHSRSQLDHVFWLLVDFSGILTFSIVVGLQRLVMRHHSSDAYNALYILSLLTISYLQYWSTAILFVLKPFWKARHVIRIVTCFSAGVWPYIPLLDRYWPHYGPQILLNSTATSPEAAVPLVADDLGPHTNALNWLLVSGIFMGANVPECLAPGCFDYFFYGHQIFHLCIFMVAWNVCEGAKQDAMVVPREVLSPDHHLFDTVYKIMVFTVLSVIVTIYTLVRAAKAQLLHGEKKVA